jgi:uncharacterized protein (DUF2141 family)
MTRDNWRYPMRTLLFPLVLVLALATGASAQSSGKLSVAVTGVRTDSGSVRCGLYSSADGFREPGREMRGVAAPIKNGQATCVFNAVPAGTYAVAVFHAEHNETQMETGLFGKPKQGYGFSNNPSSTFGPPGFASAAFACRRGAQPSGAAELLAAIVGPHTFDAPAGAGAASDCDQIGWPQQSAASCRRPR